MRDHDARAPAGRTASTRRLDPVGIEAGAGEQPGDHRVRVPHLARVAFVSTPDQGGDVLHEIEDLRRSVRVLRHPDGARDSLRDVWDDAVSPPTDLISEETETSDEFRSDRSFQDDSPPLTLMIGDRRLFDHEAARRGGDNESRVIEIARTSSLKTRADHLEKPPAQPHDVLPRAQRYPVEIHRCGRLECIARGSEFPGPHAVTEHDAAPRRQGLTP
jgi:hypothetical protein